MTDHGVFLKSIVENPADDSFRLVYADFLEEHCGAEGVARAEEIRGNVEPRTKAHTVVVECWADGNKINTYSDATRAWLTENNFNVASAYSEARFPDGQIRFMQATAFQATYRLGYIERISGSVSDWQRVGVVTGASDTGHRFRRSDSQRQS